MVTGYLMLNKDEILALAASITLSAVVAEVLADQPDYLNYTYSLITGYCVYYAIFTTLYWVDNRREYKLESGKTDVARLKTDLKKIIFAFGLAEAVYAVVRWTGQYYLLTLGYEPYISPITSQTVASAMLLAMINLATKKTHLYK